MSRQLLTLLLLVLGGLNVTSEVSAVYEYFHSLNYVYEMAPEGRSTLFIEDLGFDECPYTIEEPIYVVSAEEYKKMRIPHPHCSCKKKKKK